MLIYILNLWTDIDDNLYIFIIWQLNTDNSIWQKICNKWDWLIDWCLMSTLVIFQLYRGVNKIYFQLKTLTRLLEIKHTCLYVKIAFNMIDFMHKQCKICKKKFYSNRTVSKISIVYINFNFKTNQNYYWKNFNLIKICYNMIHPLLTSERNWLRGHIQMNFHIKN